MNKTRFILLLVGAVLFFLIVGSTLVLNRPELLPQQLQEKFEKTEAVAKVRVIAGNEFDIWTVSGERIHGFLEVDTPSGTGSEVAGAVQKLFNECQNPMVKILRKDGDAWKIELYLQVNGKRVILSEYLKQNSMVWK